MGNENTVAQMNPQPARRAKVAKGVGSMRMMLTPYQDSRKASWICLEVVAVEVMSPALAMGEPLEL